ncbi:MAG TPA: glycosyltransferase family 87 protein, partial [Candidatus Dormibacteraeota bacterium]|nr:glycosyltransferase family 87 protein [Candidatus Dormibacteraeota bacterium]
MSPTPPARPRARRSLAGLALLGAVAVLVANAAAQPFRAERHPDETDWVAFASGARVLDAGSTCLYCTDEIARVQTDLLGFRPRSQAFPNPFANPPAVAWLLRPAGRLPLQGGLAVMEVLSIAALLLAGLAFRRRMRGTPRATAVTVAALLSLPAAETLALAQWDAVLVAAAVGAVLCLERDRDAAAGLLLSLLLVKPQLVWLAVPALLVAGRWRALAGFAAGAVAWGVTGLALVGTGGLRQWLDLV